MPAFLAPVHYPVGAYPTSLVAADFNNDNVQDLAVANGTTVSVLLGIGDGTFQSALDSATGMNPHSLAVGDFNGDGTMDLATGHTDYYYGYYTAVNEINVLLGIEDADGNGTGTFAPPARLGFFGEYPPVDSLAVGDFNGDGLLDLGATANDYAGWGVVNGYYWYGSVRALLGHGDGSFSASPPINITGRDGVMDPGVVATDVNGDSFDDLVTVSWNASGSTAVTLVLGRSSGVSHSRYQVCSTSSPAYLSVAAGDLDADHDIDLVVADYLLHSVTVLLGDGAGSFTEVGNYATGNYPRSVVLGDFTGDGRVDIATGSSVLYGGGDGTFSSPVSIPFADGVTADFNGDGWLDAAMLNSIGGVSVLINDQSWPSSPPPFITIQDATVTEGNTGTTNASFVVTLSSNPTESVTIDYATADGSATTADGDYQNTFGSLTFNPGEPLTQTVTVLVQGDRRGELNETFFVNLRTASNVSISDGQGVATITDDEPTVSIGNASVTERNSGTTALSFTVSLSAIYDADVTVSFTTQDGSATTTDNDYQAASGTATIAAGARTTTVTILVNGDQKVEPNETVAVFLSNPTNARIVGSSATGTIYNDDAVTKFYVVDASSDKTFEYGPDGAAVENYRLPSGNNDPRGAASSAAGDRVWVIDNDDYVYVYDAAGTPLGAWKANGLSAPEGIASNGVDIWIVDRDKDKVFRFAGAAGRISGSASATSSFALNSGNRDATGIETDGTHLWVVNDASTNKIFKYTLSGALVGSWTISGNNTTPTGITLDPSNPSDIWIVDSGRDQVFRYTAAAGRTSGSQSPSAVFNLAPGNTNPQGIADPSAAAGGADFEELRVPFAATGSPASAFTLAEVIENNRWSSPSSFPFLVRLSAPSTEPVTVGFGKAESARARTDSTDASDDEAFTPGDTSESIPLLVDGETKMENNESFSDNPTDVYDAVFADTGGLARILRDARHRSGGGSHVRGT